MFEVPRIVDKEPNVALPTPFWTPTVTRCHTNTLMLASAFSTLVFFFCFWQKFADETFIFSFTFV